MTRKFKVIFFSEVNSKFGVNFFKKLLDDEAIEIVAFVTTPAGKLCSYYIGEDNPVNLEILAKNNGIEVFRPDNVNDEGFRTTLSELNPDYFLVANYQKIFKKELLEIPTKETFNFHPSPLPRYAGLAPFFWMARNTEKWSGVSCIRVTPEIDGGDIVEQIPVALTGTETSRDIRNILFDTSLELLEKILKEIKTKILKYIKQDDHLRNYFSNPHITDKTICQDMRKREAEAIIRACDNHDFYILSDDKIISIKDTGVKKGNKINYELKDGMMVFYAEGVEHGNTE